MPFRDLRSFIEKLQTLGDVVLIEHADWDIEIGTLTELMCEREGPLLLFDKIKGYADGFRIAAHPYSSRKRTAILLDMSPEIPRLEIVDRWRNRLREYKPIKPRFVETGPVTENVLEGDGVDLLKFPAPKWHERDGGRYLGTGCIFITQDVNRNLTNLGTYRMQLHDSVTAGIHIEPFHHGYIMMKEHWEKGISCPVAVAIGPPPSVFLAGGSALPWGASEYDYAGWINGEPIDVIRAPHTGLPVPTTAEIIIEGEIPPPSVEAKIEGPFGEYHGYYASGAILEPVIRVRTLLHRQDPIIQGNPPLRPPLAHFGASVNHASMWNQMEKSLPGIKAVYAHPAGGGGHIFIVTIQQKYAGHAKQAGLLLTANGRTVRYVIVTDDDIDPSNMDEVMWAVATRADPATSITIINDMPSSALDPNLHPSKKSRPEAMVNTRAIINACRPFDWFSDFPILNKASEDTRRKTLQKWKELFDRH